MAINLIAHPTLKDIVQRELMELEESPIEVLR